MTERNVDSTEVRELLSTAVQQTFTAVTFVMAGESPEGASRAPAAT
jgi:hypothetical protein